MVRDQFILDLNRELIVDNFAGGGGASTGIYNALGRHVDHAINHDPIALGMHRINHPQTVHHPTDVFDIDPVQLANGRRVGFGWFSPDCKHFSKAKGGKPLDKKIRGLVLVMLKWAKIGTRVFSMENVEEIKTWGPLLHHAKHTAKCICGKPCGRPDPKHIGRTWRAFLDALSTGLDRDHPDIPEMLEVLGGSVTKVELVQGFGYEYEVGEIRACAVGSPTIRKRLILIARCDGLPIVWPQPTHTSPESLAVHTVTPTGERRLKPYRIIAECIDWWRPCPSIFLTRMRAKKWKIRCKRPLKKPTMRRIAVGVGRYVMNAERPFIVSLTHQGGDRIESIDEPARSITGAHRGERALVDTSVVAPFVTEHANASHQRNFPIDEPARTQCAEVKGGHFALVAGALVRTAHGERDKNGKKRGRGTHAVTESMPTMLGTQEFAFSAAYLTKFCTGSVGTEVTKPCPTIVAGNHAENTHGGAATVHGLVAASMVSLRGKPSIGNTRSYPVDEPGRCVSAGGFHNGLSCAYLAQHNAGNNTNPGHAVTEPISTISGKGAQQQLVSANLAAYYGSEADGQAIDEPLRAVTAKARFGLATSHAVDVGLTKEQLAGARRVARFLHAHGVKFEGEFAAVGDFIIVDIGMRMLVPRELFRAQGFPEDYVIDRAWLVDPSTGEIMEVKLSKEAQIRMCGNSVCPDVAEAVARCNVPEMAVWSGAELAEREVAP